MKIRLTAKREGGDMWDAYPGPYSKVSFVKTVRMLTGYDLKEALDVANALGRGQEQTIEVQDDHLGVYVSGLDAKMSLSLLDPWVTINSKPCVRLPIEIAELVEAYRTASDLERYGYDRERVVMWGRGKADPDCLGLRVRRLLNELGRMQLVALCLDAAAHCAKFDGSSGQRAEADVGAMFLARLANGPSESQPLIPPVGGRHVSPAEVLAERAAAMLEELCSDSSDGPGVAEV